ncbi:hypothetical protein FIA58_000620 [Flavobacterium jejuense]|uniref:Uncharacterized protein n=1 Tax=Flavobacterium jejuense TaxID=1544455 RepID=A0ABX0IQP6_9FLAO|nr:hypothetical protein [Flavobacterium jejuense]NHN24165.1 hypothetical protein [Flavobacterium jejuense]
MKKYKKKIIEDGKLARILALGSFSIGTLILIIFKITKSDILFIIGFYYVVIALFLNFILFVNLVYNLFIYTKMYAFQFGNIALLLLNIPIALFYLQIVL